MQLESDLFTLFEKNHTHVKKMGYSSEFLFGIYSLPWNTIIKKLLTWANKKQNNFNIYNVALKKKQKKHLQISLSKSWWYDLQFLRYRAKHTEIGNFRSFFALLPPKNPKNQNFEKWKNLLEISSFYTCVPKITIIWCMVPEIQSETDRIFYNWAIFCPFSTPSP